MDSEALENAPAVRAIGEEITRIRHRHHATEAASIPPAPSQEALMGITIEPGTPVLDLLTGLQGVVKSGRIERSIVSPAGVAPAANSNSATE